MYVIKISSNRIWSVAILFHDIVKHIQIWNLTCENISSDIWLGIVQVSDVGFDLLFFPLFIDYLSQCSDIFKEIIEKIIVLWNHTPLKITLIVCIFCPHVYGLNLFNYFVLELWILYFINRSLILFFLVWPFHQQLINGWF